MNAFSCWLERAVGLALAVIVLTGDANAQPGRADVKGQVIGNRPGEDAPRGLPGITVELRPTNGKAITLPKTGEDGKFSIEEIPAGEYLLYISASGYAPHEAKLYCTQGGVTQLTVRLERSQPGQKKPQLDPLPGAGKITWDVRVLEGSPLFEVVRREFKGRKVTWLLENTEGNPGGLQGFRADFLDADGVTIRSVEFQYDLITFNWRAGARNRLILTLPEMEDLHKTCRVVLGRF